MSSVDEFESVFNAAAKPVFQHAPPPLGKALVVTDLQGAPAEIFSGLAQKFLSPMQGPWETLDGGEFQTVKELLDAVDARKPDLVVTYRHLQSQAWRWPYSLGEHLDVLIQVAQPPVAILPHPGEDGTPETPPKNTDSVMAITDHLAGLDGLVNYAAAFTNLGGTLHLTHVECATTLDRYLDAIGKIPEIDTDIAREKLTAQLLREPAAYIESCTEVLKENGTDLTVAPHVEHGHRLEEFRRAAEENTVDLVVLEGHDEDQLAMNATAYSLAVELRNTPVLIV